MSRRRAFITIGTALVCYLGVAAPAIAQSAPAHPAAGATSSLKPVHSLKVINRTSSSISLSWKNPSSPSYAGAIVRYAKGSKAPATAKKGHLVAKVRKPAHKVTAKGLARSTKYSFAVFAYTKAGKYAKIAKITATTTSGFLTGVKTVVTNSNDACALFTSGKVDCWGYNDSDNLGSGVASSFVLKPVPVKAIGGHGVLTGVRSIATDGGGFCGLLKSSALDCWGDNSDGDLGNAGTSQPVYPVAVKGIGGHGKLTGVAGVIGGYFSYCALLKSGRVDCWGSNYQQSGQLGTGTTATSNNEVEAVKGVGGSGNLSKVSSVIGNNEEMCALLTSSAVDCWGNGPLGDDSVNPSNFPVKVLEVGGSEPLTGVAKVRAMGNTICAVLTSGRVDCWGLSALGAGSGALPTDHPVAVEGVSGTGLLSGVADVVGDGQTTCALLTSGRVDCWGDDNVGQLGVKPLVTSDEATVPVQVMSANGAGLLAGVVHLSTSAASFCAVLSSKHVDCWGENNGAELGNGGVSGPDLCANACGILPAPVVSITGKGSIAGIATLVPDSIDKVGGLGYYAITATGGVDYWGAGTNEQGLFGKDKFGDSNKYSVPARA
jgi:alpha-tubulin suppressor-like RCC1 family protein